MSIFLETLTVFYFLSYPATMLFCAIDMRVTATGRIKQRELKEYFIQEYVFNSMRPDGTILFIWETWWFIIQIAFFGLFILLDWKYALLAVGLNLAIRFVNREYQAFKHRDEIAQFYAVAASMHTGSPTSWTDPQYW